MTEKMFDDIAPEFEQTWQMPQHLDIAIDRQPFAGRQSQRACGSHFWTGNTFELKFGFVRLERGYQFGTQKIAGCFASNQPNCTTHLMMPRSALRRNAVSWATSGVVSWSSFARASCRVRLSR